MTISNFSKLIILLMVLINSSKIALTRIQFTEAQGVLACSDYPLASQCSRGRNFNSVLIAIHGWGGACGSTFGTEERSLLQYLGNNNFFDVDCFDYKSTADRMPEVAEQFRQRLRDLYDAGYRHIMIFTHSLGGIVALQTFTDFFYNNQNQFYASANEFDRDIPPDLHIEGLSIWASPINGVRHTIEELSGLTSRFPLASWLANQILGTFDNNTVKDIYSGSSYLENLKVKLENIEVLRQSDFDHPQKFRLSTPVIFYQGQENDWVVNSIDASPNVNKWIWPRGYGGLFETTDDHLSILADAVATSGMPVYPSRILDLESINRLPFLPRYEQIFPMDGLYNEALLNQQERIIYGMSYYIREKQYDAHYEISEFLKQYINGRFNSRIEKVDAVIFTELEKFVQYSNMRQHQVDLLCELLTDVVSPFQFGGVADDGSRFMKNSARTGALVRLYSTIISKLESFSNRPDLVVPAKCEEFAINSPAFLQSGLSSPHTPVQMLALQEIDELLPRVINEAVVEELAVAVDARFALETQQAALTELTRERYSSIYEHIFRDRSPAIRANRYAVLNSLIGVGGEQRPAVAFLNNSQVAMSMFRSIEANELESPAEIEFLGNIVRTNGFTGTGNQITTEVIQYTVAREDLAESAQDQGIIRESIEQSLDRFGNVGAISAGIGDAPLEIRQPINPIIQNAIVQ